MNLLNLPLAILDLSLVVARVVGLTLIASVKAILPMRWLPKKDVRGSTVLVTGSGSGLGRQLAVEFAMKGSTLVLWDINAEANEATKAEVEVHGVQAHTYTVDLSSRTNISRAANQVKQRLGHIDILINCAGIVVGKKLDECTEDEIELTFRVNAMAGLFLTRHFLPSMLQRNHGHVVTIASIAGKLGCSDLVDYSSSKFAAVGAHHALSEELRYRGASGVRTTLVCPFFIDTGMFSGVVSHSPILLPIASTEYAATKILHAVLTDQAELFFPRFLYLACLSFALVPHSVTCVLLDYFQIPQAMSGFTGRGRRAEDEGEEGEEGGEGEEN